MTIDELKMPALVFSPHPDDETLGCGGTIIRKVQLGADVKVVFMTDGSNSHSHLMPAEELKNIRTDEALSAAKKLGLSRDDLYFLEFPDGALYKHLASATTEVRNILETYPDYQVFAPYRREDLRDHRVTNNIVRNAMLSRKSGTTMYEFPIWYWAHWPWISLHGSLMERFSILRSTVVAQFGLRMATTFRCGVLIKDVTSIKRSALAEHKSQMEELIAHKQWSTLSEFADGQFLDCFFQEYEYFFRHEYRAS